MTISISLGQNSPIFLSLIPDIGNRELFHTIKIVKNDYFNPASNRLIFNLNLQKCRE
jgi:hypothetical protein